MLAKCCRAFEILVGWAILSAFHTPAFAQTVSHSTAVNGAAAMPALEAVKFCLTSARGAECLDNLFAEARKTYSPIEILQRSQRLSCTPSAEKLIGSRAIFMRHFPPAIKLATPAVIMAPSSVFTRRRSLFPSRQTPKLRRFAAPRSLSADR